MKKKGIILLFFVVVAILIGVLSRSKSSLKSTGATTDAVTTEPVATPERPSIEAFGLVKPTEVMNINIDFPARVRRLYVQEGEKVTLGQPLLALEVEEYRTEIRATEYELQLARHELKQIESEIARLSTKITEKEKQLVQESAYELSQIKSDLRKAQQDLATKKALLKVNAIPAEEVASLEKTVVDLSRSYAHIRTEKETELKDLKAELTLNGLGIQKERVKLLEAKLEMLRKKLDQSFIRNDELISNLANGVVSAIGYAEGDLITAERKIFSIINLDSLIVKANLAEEFIKDVHPGTEAIITPVADYSRTYPGKVIRRSDLAITENGETVVPIEISIENRDDFLLPNFNVDVIIYK